jgi:Ca2+-binding EF-hand superfamily protein
MDLNGSESLKIEEFMFGVQFFCGSVSLPEILMLFKKLDSNNDGIIDLTELGSFLPSRTGSNSAL